MAQELIQVDARKLPVRIVFVVVIAMATVWSYYAFRWFFGNTMAEYFNTGQNNLQLAQIAHSLSPNDPLTNWRLGQVAQKRLPIDQSASALADYERAVSLSPNDYRYWMSLGVAREQSGEVDAAEQALRHAIALAPSYSYPHWYLGNLLLRRSRYDEGFVELRTAGESDPSELRGQYFNLMAQVYEHDIESLKRAVGPNAETRAQFALYLVTQNKRDEGLAIWQTLGADEKKANKGVGDSIVSNLVNSLHFRDAVLIWNELAPTSAYRVEEGRITDGSFEELISYGPEVAFGWQVKNVPNMQIGIDPNVGYLSERSLRLLFQVRTKLESINVSQLIPVASETTYDFEYFYKTSKLQSGGALMVQVFDASNGGVLASPNSAPSGDTDWTRVAMTFKTAKNTEAVRVQVTKGPCGGEDNLICPIFGTVWYDDFSLKRHN
jgi:tetratricopeptide (TPR) repeat protein